MTLSYADNDVSRCERECIILHCSIAVFGRALSCGSNMEAGHGDMRRRSPSHSQII
jgi:hypothetical protein